MKRIFSILLALSLLCGCSAEKSKFELPYFSKNAIISCRNFEYDCNISYSKEGVTIDVLSTAAKGLSIYYNGNEISFSYGDIKILEQNRNFELTNPAIAVFDLISVIKNQSDVELKKENNSYNICGKTKLGDFIADFDEDFQPVSVRFSESDFEIEFK